MVDELGYDMFYKDILNDTSNMIRYLYTKKDNQDTLKKSKKIVKKFVKKYNEEGLYGILEDTQ